MSDQPITGRLLRGYGPLIGFLAVFTAMALLVPTVSEEGGSSDAADLASTVDADGDGVPDAEEAAAAEAGGGAGPDGSSAAESADSAGPGSGAAGDNTAQPGAAGPGANAAAPLPLKPGELVQCTGPQLPNDPYSPPCRKFNGNNGGATYRGVTDKEITIAVRQQNFTTGLVDAIAKQARADVPDESAEKIVRTLEGLVEYFNKYYEFYGRKLKLVTYSGRGDLLLEATGNGKDGASADALKVAQEIKAFADVASVTEPYASALSSQGVVNIGAPYMSRDYFASRGPFAWSSLTDCSTIVETVASWYLTRMAGRGADLAGGNLKGQPRKVAIVAPGNYQQCVDAGLKIVRDAGKGNEIGLTEQYVLNLQTLSNQAVNLVPKLKQQGITTIICGCDPLFTTFLTQKASEQKYEPEWIQTGVALMDNDLVGRLFTQKQWCRATGPSFTGPTIGEREGIGYRAYKSVRGDEPSIAVELMYYNLQVLAIGIQLAGAKLTPQTFQIGMYSYPASNGPAGRWKFGPGDHTPGDDARELAWSATRRSVLSGKSGAYVDVNNGARYSIGKWPAGGPKPTNECG